MASVVIENVGDTALWVAHHRAVESARADALFRDPYAARLAGERGRAIAKSMGPTSRYTAWTLAIRTRVIDEMIFRLLAEGVDMVVNLGAGLDSRPYRLDLPASLPWIEVDQAQIIRHKEDVLAGETPRCRLERVSLDLSLGDERRKLLASLAARGKKILVITEGVIPYLTEEQVAELARDLHAEPTFRFWVAEYLAPETYRFLRNARRTRQMKNAPFRFLPADWKGFFTSRGWRERETIYLGEETIRLHRRPPSVWWARLLYLFASAEKKRQFLRMSGYMLLERS